MSFSNGLGELGLGELGLGEMGLGEMGGHLRLSHYHLTPSLQGKPAKYPHKPYIAGNFAADSVGLSSFKFSWWAPKNACVLKHSEKWPFKVIQGH